MGWRTSTKDTGSGWSLVGSFPQHPLCPGRSDSARSRFDGVIGVPPFDEGGEVGSSYLGFTNRGRGTHETGRVNKILYPPLPILNCRVG